MRNKSKVYQITDEEFKELIANNYSYSDCLRKLGLGTRGGHSTDVIKKRIKELGCTTEHFKQTNSSGWIPHKLVLEDVFAQNSCTNSSHTVRKLVLRHNLLPYKCALCGITEWAGKPISLQLHHENGIKTDNRLENLKFLCPNCHAQTDNYGSKNKQTQPTQTKRIVVENISHKNKYSAEETNKETMTKRPNKETLEFLINNHTNVEIGKMYNVAPQTISKWMKVYGIERKKYFELISEDLRKQYEKGKTIHELAETYNVASNTMREYLHKLGFKFNGNLIPINIYDYKTNKYICTCKSIEEAMRHFKYHSFKTIKKACETGKEFKGCRLEYTNQNNII